MKKGTYNDITGQNRNRLTAIAYVGQNQFRQSVWRFKCDCGKEVVTVAANFLDETTKSCGCWSTEKRRTHGMSETGTYNSWWCMIDRCFNTKHPHYSDYGGRGIRVCEFLRAIPNNLALLIGERGEDLTIGRIDNNGHYSCGICAECLQCGHPLNVRWETRKEQMNNTRSNVKICRNGVTRTIAQWSEELGISAVAMYQRVSRGRDPFAPYKRRKSPVKKEVPNS